MIAAACGNDTQVVDGMPVLPDEPVSECQATGAIGQFTRRTGNPQLLAGRTYSDGKLDISIADPDVRREGGTWHVYWSAAHAMTYSEPSPPMLIRHATTTDRTTYAIDDTPALEAGPPGAWDHENTETPTVVMNPAAPPDRRYLMMYSGATAPFPHPGYGFPEYGIGAAFSADGKTFTRVPASQSKDGKAGLVLRGVDAYPGQTGSIVADPELVLVDGVYHLFFSSFACRGAQCETVHAFGVSHATSPDGIAWTIVAAPIRSLLRSSVTLTSGGAQPSVVYDERRCKWELWQTSDLAGELDDQPAAFNNTKGVWKAESDDGLAWFVDYTRTRDFQWSATQPGETLGMLTGVDVGDDDTGRFMLYVGFDDDNVPMDFLLPARAGGVIPGVFSLNIATRDLP